MDGASIAAEIAKDLVKELFKLGCGAFNCHSSAASLRATVESLLPVVSEIRLSPASEPAKSADSVHRHRQLSELNAKLLQARELARRAAELQKWDFCRAAQLAVRMKKAEQWISRWLVRYAPLHALADVRQLRAESDVRIDRIERRIEEIAAAATPVVGTVATVTHKGFGMDKFGLGFESDEGLGVGIKVGKEKVKGMLMRRGGLVGIYGIGGSGKTTLAKAICRDPEIRDYFQDRIYFETVSQCPDPENLKLKLWEQISGNMVVGTYGQIPEWQFKLAPVERVPTLVVLDDVRSLTEFEDLIASNVNGYTFLVVSRFNFPTMIADTYEMELLGEDDALALFCISAFSQETIPPSADKKLVKQVMDECKGLPLALKVTGACLRGEPPKMWLRAKSQLSQGEAISDSHRNKVLDHLAVSVNTLSEEVRECFLDLGSFPEDKRIPLDVLINIWMEIHDLEEIDAYAVLSELSNKNLLTLEKEAQKRAGDLYSGYTELFVTQHDVLRDLALHMNNSASLTCRRRVVMPRRGVTLPREWERCKDKPFEARIVSVHTGEMRESDWFRMHFPNAEVLIMNFSSDVFFLPPFMDAMPNLRVLVLMNYGNSTAVLDNLSVFTATNNLRSLWLERITLPPLPWTTVPLNNLLKISLILCDLNRSLNGSTIDLSLTFPNLVELSFDHCIDLKELPGSICKITSLTSMTVSNCHDLTELPTDLGNLGSLEILRVLSCPMLKHLPPSLCRLKYLKYLDISQCINLRDLPEEIGCLVSLEKIDMRECSQLSNIPRSLSSLRSLSHIVCDEEMAVSWKESDWELPELRIQIAEQSYNLDWLVD